jgi:hypothetical protein
VELGKEELKVATESERPSNASDAQVTRAAQRLRELEASGTTLPEILGGKAGIAFVRDYCDGDPAIATAAFALVHPPANRGDPLEGKGRA